MDSFLKALGCLCVVLTVSSISQAKDWRGIIPLHSTRAEVEALLGEPPPPKDGKTFYAASRARSVYFLEEGEVLIVYANEEVQAAAECSGKISADAVLLIKVTPAKGLRLSELPVDTSRLTKFDPSNPPGLGYEGFVDEEEGIVIRSREGQVEQVAYIAASRDRRWCPGYYAEPKNFVSLLVCGLSAATSCPTVSVTPPGAESAAGAPATFSASVSGGDPGVTPTYRWAVTAGRIVSGQDSWAISVDTAGAAEQTIKATVEVGGYDRSCLTEASGEVRIRGGGEQPSAKTKPPRKP